MSVISICAFCRKKFRHPFPKMYCPEGDCKEIAQGNKPSPLSCPHCQAVLPEGVTFCWYCDKSFAKEIEIVKLACKRCDYRWTPKKEVEAVKYCPKCKSPYWNRERGVTPRGRPTTLRGFGIALEAGVLKRVIRVGSDINFQFSYESEELAKATTLLLSGLYYVEEKTIEERVEKQEERELTKEEMKAFLNEAPEEIEETFEEVKETSQRKVEEIDFEKELKESNKALTRVLDSFVGELSQEIVERYKKEGEQKRDKNEEGDRMRGIDESKKAIEDLFGKKR